MPSANVYDMDGQVVREENLDDYVFGAPVNTAVLHQVVTAQLVNRRQGNASTKTRSEVSGGNRKPYRQKGTGRARQGSTRAPQWRGGGAVFGPKPHPYERAIPRKMRRIAIRAALSDKVANGRIYLMEELTLEEPRTKDMEALLEKLSLDRRVLLLMPERDENVIKSAHNIPGVKVGNVAAPNVIELLKHDHVLMPLATVARLVDLFGREADDRLQMKRHPNVVRRRKVREAAAATQPANAPAASARAASPKAKAKPEPKAPAAAEETETGGTTRRRRSRKPAEEE
jgi:large subunit ribosomal protein L4